MKSKYELYKVIVEVPMLDYDSNEFYGMEEPWKNDAQIEHVDTFDNERSALNAAYSYKNGAYFVPAKPPYYVATESYVKEVRFDEETQEKEEIRCIPVPQSRDWGFVLEDPEGKGRMTKQAVRNRIPAKIRTLRDLLEEVPETPSTYYRAVDMFTTYAFVEKGGNESSHVEYITDLHTQWNPQYYNSENCDVYELIVCVDKNSGHFPTGHIIDYKILYARKNCDTQLAGLIGSTSRHHLQALKKALQLNEIDGDKEQMWTFDILADGKNCKPMHYENW